VVINFKIFGSLFLKDKKVGGEALNPWAALRAASFVQEFLIK